MTLDQRELTEIIDLLRIALVQEKQRHGASPRAFVLSAALGKACDDLKHDKPPKEAA